MNSYHSAYLTFQVLVSIQFISGTKGHISLLILFCFILLKITAHLVFFFFLICFQSFLTFYNGDISSVTSIETDVVSPFDKMSLCASHEEGSVSTCSQFYSTLLNARGTFDWVAVHGTTQTFYRVLIYLGSKWVRSMVDPSCPN